MQISEGGCLDGAKCSVSGNRHGLDDAVYNAASRREDSLILTCLIDLVVGSIALSMAK